MNDSLGAAHSFDVLVAKSKVTEGLHAYLKPGAPQLTTLAEALALAPEQGAAPFCIILAPGVYREKVKVDRPYICIAGLDAASTTIVWNDNASTPGPDGERLGTFRSQTLEVLAPDFRAEHVSIVNDWDYAANARLPKGDSKRLVNTQAVALKTDAASMRAAFVDCHFIGEQDTIYANAGTQHFLRCSITGHIDFIFGAGQAVFEDCDIVCLERETDDWNGWVAAPSTKHGVEHGFLFDHCRIKKSGQT